MLAAVESVAVLALAYRTAWRDCYQGATSLDEDMEGYSDGISLLGMIGSQALTGVDWQLIRLIDERPFPADLGVGLAEWRPERCEAVLHAWPTDPRDAVAEAEWAQPFLDRWELVAATMAGLEPVTWDRERTRDVYVAVSGQPLGEVLEHEDRKENYLG